MTKQAFSTAERINYMDAMRGVLMMLGIVLHSAHVFNAQRTWLIYSELSTPIAQKLVAGIHIFRMPAFFLISGFFCVITLQRYGVEKFLRLRMTRIGVPLVVTAVTLNSFQQWLMLETGWSTSTVQEYLAQGQWVSHLWFLINLVLYFLVASLVAKWMSGPAKTGYKLLEGLFLRIPTTLWLFIFPVYTVALKAAERFGVPIDGYGSEFSSYSLLFNFQFFLVGALIAGNRRLLERFSSIGILTIGVVICVAVWLHSLSVEGQGLHYAVARVWTDSLVMWAATAFCLGVFTRLADSDSRVFRWLSDASYSVYLFHHCLVVAFGLIFIYLGIGNWYGMLLLIMLVAITASAIHQYLVRPIPIMLFLFNGK